MSNLRGIDGNLMEPQQQRKTLQTRVLLNGFHPTALNPRSPWTRARRSKMQTAIWRESIFSEI